ncbi:uncharacterized protein LOC129901638 [Solanum dulcamara]|uniref:uncharacterized protein LOC129901638 n=1 Tax=Solanum dulcamara TaxID=45834 RepID=UPI002485585E|nr:uncharacterized protein LOC129901638 [Solanum dulcamara]
MQLTIFSSGVNRILLKKIPNYSIGILNLLNICLLLLIVSTPTIQGMRVHPLSLKRNIGIDSNFSQQQQQIPCPAMKKLRKLPHVFNNVLELPFRSDEDVAVEEKEGFFRFMAKIELEGAGDGQVRAQAVEIHPGVTKIVVRKGNANGEDEIKLLLEQLNVDTWRYRLPASTMPELATAVFVDGELVVTVPKGESGRGDFADGSRGVWGGGGRLVLVQ